MISQTTPRLLRAVIEERQQEAKQRFVGRDDERIRTFAWGRESQRWLRNLTHERTNARHGAWRTRPVRAGVLTLCDTPCSRSVRLRAALFAAALVVALTLTGPTGEANAASGTLTYIKDGNVFVSPANGSAAAQVTSDATPSSPYVAASQSASGMVVAVRGDTAYRLAQSGQQLAPPRTLPGGALGGGGVSPDGRTLAYVTSDLCGIGIPRACTSTRFLSLETGAVLPGNGTQMQNPVWAGGGDFGDAEVVGPAGCFGVYRAAPGRGNLQPWISLLESPWDSLNAPGCVRGAAASPDGRRLIVASSSSTESSLILAIVDRLGEGAFPKCRQDATGPGHEPHPVWSPNGGAIAWDAPDGIWTEDIVDLGGSDEGCVANGDTQRLAIPGASRPSWSEAAFDPRRIDTRRPPEETTPPGGSTDTTKPTAKVRVAPAVRLRTLLKGLKVKVTCSEAATATVALKVQAKTARTLGLKARKGRRATIATGRARCARGRRAVVTVKPSAKIAKRLRRTRRSWKATLSITLADAAGNARTTSEQLTIRR